MTRSLTLLNNPVKTYNHRIRLLNGAGISGSEPSGAGFNPLHLAVTQRYFPAATLSRLRC